MVSRRGFLAAGGVALVGRVLSPFSPLSAQSSDDTYFAWEQLAEGVRIAWGGGGASMVVSSGGESVLVDCKGYGLGTTLRREVEADGNRLVGVINTHHHSAQTGGNIAFTPEVEVIAQRRAGPRIVAAVEGVLEALRQDPDDDLIVNRRRQIADMAHSDAGARQALADFDAHIAAVDSIVPGNFGPSATFDDSFSIEVGEIDVELRHVDRAHTDNDVLVWIPSRGIMHVGNLLYIDAHPVIDAPRGGSIRGWQRTLERARELAGAEATILPSDGGLIAATADFGAQITYFDELRALAQNAIDAGMSRQETVDFIPSTGMGRFSRLASPERFPVNLGVAYDELSAAPSAASAVR
jgi:glyoxylase-like metal-dependent hydrolase (beta-lactamase superfamily II)